MNSSKSSFLKPGSEIQFGGSDDSVRLDSITGLRLCFSVVANGKELPTCYLDTSRYTVFTFKTGFTVEVKRVKAHRIDFTARAPGAIHIRVVTLETTPRAATPTEGTPARALQM